MEINFEVTGIPSGGEFKGSRGEILRWKGEGGKIRLGGV